LVLASKIDRVDEGNRTQFATALGNCGVDKIAPLCLGGRHVPQLQGVQELIAYFREMRAYNARGFFVRDHRPQTEQLHERPGNEAPDDHGHGRNGSPEKRGARTRAKVPKVLQQRGQEKNTHQQARTVQSTADQPVLVELADEGVELRDQVLVVAVHGLAMVRTRR
jgi:hypothetical protein